MEYEHDPYCRYYINIMTDRLIHELKKIEDFPQEELDNLCGCLVKKFIAKGEHFLNPGQISRHIAFIDSGLLMHYSLRDGIEIPCNFSVEGDWTGSLRSFESGLPTEIAIRALEDTWLREISAEQIQKLFRLSPRWLQFKNHLVQQVFFNITQHNADLTGLSAKERYYKFMQEKPELFNRIPQYYIAAYLGITPQSLSRIRKTG